MSCIAVWPPRDLPLAAALFPERDTAGESSLDRFTATLLRPLNRHAGTGARAERAFLAQIAAEGEAMRALSDDALRHAARASAKPAFAALDRASAARTLAALSQASQRALGLTPHKPQLLAAWRMIQGCLIELDTGEGKTLTAGLTATFAALAGVPVHVVTVNDYLAQRDAESLAPLFRFFALDVGVVHSGVAQPDRAAQYAKAITYCTNKDLTFDYLRDRVTAKGLRSLAQMAVQRLNGDLALKEELRLRGLHFAIVDEADSVLLDEARTPLILSAMREGTDDGAMYAALLDVARGLEADRHYHLDEAQARIELLPAGRGRLAQVAKERDEGDAELWRSAWIREHYALQALRALHLFRRDQHYVVADGKVVIVDEFTGRMLADRSWEQGLHQLVEAKEGCALSGNNVTLARITYQAFFGRYLRLAGMSGTIRETSREIAAAFGMACVRIEPNRPSRRIELPSRLLADEAAKIAAVVGEVQAMLEIGRPVLVGTRSVHASQVVSAALQAAGVPHRLLNALQNADEAELVGAAGQAGAVTVATNMAGRGTDIRLAPDVVQRGGLHVVLTEWHESSRIDRQLFGRCARQGDPGSVRAIVALDDEVIVRHASAHALVLSRRWPAGRWPAWAIQSLRRHVQRRAESANARQRRLTVRQDRRMRDQLAFSGADE